MDDRNDQNENNDQNTDKHLTKQEIKEQLDKIKFPSPIVKEREDYVALIAVLLYQGADVFELREALADKLMEVQKEIIMQNAIDVMNGKYKSVEDMEERMPLFRKEYPDGSAEMLNVPDEFMQWASFIGTLNEEYFEGVV